MNDSAPSSGPTSSEDLREWQRRLGRLRLGAEPLAEQLARLRRVTWALTFVPLGFAAIIVALFTGFGAPLIGLAVAGIVFGPVIALAWLDDLRRSAVVRAFERAHPERSETGGP